MARCPLVIVAHDMSMPGRRPAVAEAPARTATRPRGASLEWPPVPWDVKPPGFPCAFTLVELIVVVAILALLAALLLPALSKARQSPHRTACLSNLHQQGIAWRLYLDDHAGRFPDRRDLKSSLPGGYRPWASWPASDPRAGWAALVLSNTLGIGKAWSCPGASSAPWSQAPQAGQPASADTNAPPVRYWMWRFDRADDPVPPDNFWNRTEDECVTTLRSAATTPSASPVGPSDVELTVDVYFPGTIAAVPEPLRGRAAHANGRNRLMLDGHAAFLRDPRTPSR